LPRDSSELNEVFWVESFGARLERSPLSSWQLSLESSWGAESSGGRTSGVWLTGNAGVTSAGKGSDFPIAGEMNDSVVTNDQHLREVCAQGS
jgi:hypothetical protein